MHKRLTVYQLNCFLSATNFCLSQILPAWDTMWGSRGCCQSVELLITYQAVETRVFSAANKVCTKNKKAKKPRTWVNYLKISWNKSFQMTTKIPIWSHMPLMKIAYWLHMKLRNASGFYVKSVLYHMERDYYRCN